MTKKLGYIIFVSLCIIVGLYPALYFMIDTNFGILKTKSNLLLGNGLWNISFYAHISLGGLALLIGWTQFIEKFRKNNKNLHGNLFTVYLISVIFSGFSALYLAYHATGGMVSTIGFSILAFIWIFSTFRAFLEIKNGSKRKYQIFMIYSYAACFSAVTLRFWQPILMSFFDSYIMAYRVLAWLSWVPNIIVAYYMTKPYRLSKYR
ncbi:DUF2306 domain-containing protein [Psychroserpens sp.]|uniref:DUF2306 domain-containing protein n=1 Tax=Psychroserpens sp. TaxID=2020870 RepID=UPI003858FD19